MRVVANGLEPRLEGGVADVVRRLCGVQAQDAGAARLAIRARSHGLRAQDVDAEPAVVRVWAWRGTLHLLARDDVAWVLSLIAERAQRSVAARWRALGLDDEVYGRARGAILERLQDGPATRAQLREALAAAGVDASGQRLPHLVRRVALEGRLHHPLDGTFAALQAGTEPPGREHALAELGRRYCAGYGPAEARDLAAFCGLPAADARAAWTSAEAHASVARADAPPGRGWVRLLGAFDPYLLGYRGRAHAVPAGFERAVRPGGGWIHPVVLVDARAAGTWRIEGGRVAVEAFGAVAIPEAGLAAEVQDVARFLGRALEV